ncbi:type 4a pilus biogenesis protein PilO [Litorilinea aerophila]|uniref:LysM peptidoglycan-binding domain-containing protein n=1 Tax=Litorilinea aerophila TaxID=1204385 RepID=A0A540VDN7_9CHLR|nr:type 4a pilus biogenesis protein PilO [Litorilinea aerophila]MCC9077391.1 type 4a pilus biogenesis protein PilO [Litorilinea aerophila]
MIEEWRERLGSAQNPWALAGLAVAGLLLLAILVFLLLVLMPAVQTRQSLIAQLTEQEETLAHLKEERARQPVELAEKLAAVQARVEEMAGRLLSESQAIQLMDRLYTYARSAGVTIVTVEARPASTPAIQELFAERVFGLQVRGSFSNLLDFLGRIQESNSDGVVISNVAITQGTDSQALLTMDVTVWSSPHGGREPQLAAALGTTDVSTLWDTLRQVWAANRWDDAIALLKQAQVLQPDSALVQEDLYRAYVNQSYWLLWNRSREQARLALESALSVRPDGQEARRLLQALADPALVLYKTGDALARQASAAAAAGDWRTAVRLLRQLQLIDPHSPGLSTQLYEAYLQLGYQLQATGHPAEAQEHFRMALAINPDGVEAAAALTPAAVGAPTATPTGPAALTPTPTAPPTPTVTPLPGPSPTNTTAPASPPTWTPTVTPLPTNTATATPSPTASATPTGTVPPGTTVHVVQPGETLFSIARRYGTTVEALMAANGLTSTTIRVGQRLIIVPATGVTVTPPNTTIHVVRRGETLFSIAQQYGTTVEAIMAANGMRSDRIYAGQTLRIPLP